MFVGTCDPKKGNKLGLGVVNPKICVRGAAKTNKCNNFFSFYYLLYNILFGQTRIGE
jgi:hypothetical protein